MIGAAALACADTLPLLWELIDHELAPDVAERVRAHLAVCPRCFPQYDFQRAFVVFLRRSGETPVPADLPERVRERLAPERAGACGAAHRPGGAR